MRILLINYEYPPVGGGAATATEAIGKALATLGHQVVVLTGKFRRAPKVSEFEGIVVRRIPTWRRKSDRSDIFEMGSFLVSGLMFMRWIIRKHQIDGSIVFFSLPCGPLGLFGRWQCGVPYIIALRGGDVPGTEPSLDFLHRCFTSIRRAVLNNACAIVANSTGLRKMAEAADPFPVQVIPNGVDSEFFVPGQSKPLKKSSEPLRLLFAGRFRAQKNLPFLLRELARFSPGTFELHLVGDGPERRHLERLADELGIGTRIIWHGWLSRATLRERYQAAECLVNPSLYEGMPNAVLEAMACGLPVVASRVPGNEELVIDGETGFLFDLDHPIQFRDALQRLTNDRDLASQLGSNARTQVTTRFQWRDIAQAYLDLFSATI